MWKKIKKIGPFILAIIGFLFLRDFFKKDKTDFAKRRIKRLKKKALTNRAKAEGFKKKAFEAKMRIEAIKNKYSKILPVLLALLFLLPSPLAAVYIVTNTNTGVVRDYGDITNYVKSLEEIDAEKDKMIFHLESSTIYYSNAFVELSNASALQSEVIEDQEPGLLEEILDVIKVPLAFVAGLLLRGLF